MSEGGNRSLVYGGKVDEKHVEAAAPAIRSDRCALGYDRLGGSVQYWESEGVGGVPLSKGVVYILGCTCCWEV